MGRWQITKLKTYRMYTDHWPRYKSYALPYHATITEATTQQTSEHSSTPTQTIYSTQNNKRGHFSSLEAFRNSDYGAQSIQLDDPSKTSARLDPTLPGIIEIEKLENKRPYPAEKSGCVIQRKERKRASIATPNYVPKKPIKYKAGICCQRKKRVL